MRKIYYVIMVFALSIVLSGCSETYTITFEDYDGSVIETTVVEEASSIEYPDAPSREGYNFIGWSSKPEMIIEDLSITAEYEIKKYEVLFKDFDDTTINVIDVEHGDDLNSFPDAPSREGYNFVGWSSKPEMITEDLSITAEYELIVYTVNFHSNGGFPIPSQNVSINNNLFEPDAFRDGYSFVGWFSDSNLIDSYDFSQPVNEDLDLFAKWEKHYSLTFETNSSLSVDKVITTEENFSFKTSDLPQLSQAGFTFMGWYKDAQFNSMVTEDIILNDNVVIYARWLEHMRLSFETNYNEEISPIIIIDENPSLNSSELPKLTRDGYLFEGWYLDPEFNMPVEQVINLNEHKTIYAKWIQYRASDDLKNHIISFNNRNAYSETYSTERNENGWILFFNENTKKFSIRKVYPRPEFLAPGDLLSLELDFYIVDNEYMTNEIVIANINVTYASSVYRGLLNGVGFGEFYNIKLNGSQITSFDRKAEHQLDNLMWFNIESELNSFFNGAINDLLSRIALETVQIRERISIINDLPHEFRGSDISSLTGELLSFNTSYSYYSSGNLNVDLSYRIQKTFDPSGDNSDSYLFWYLIVLDKDFTQIDQIFRSTALRVAEISLNNYSGSMPPDTPLFILFRGDGD